MNQIDLGIARDLDLTETALRTWVKRRRRLRATLMRTEREFFTLAVVERGNSGSRASAMRSLRVTPEIGLIVERYR